MAGHIKSQRDGSKIDLKVPRLAGFDIAIMSPNKIKRLTMYIKLANANYGRQSHIRRIF
jgi:hypothetical protein